jgi:hypothetical protein
MFLLVKLARARSDGTVLMLIGRSRDLYVNDNNWDGDGCLSEKRAFEQSEPDTLRNREKGPRNPEGSFKGCD